MMGIECYIESPWLRAIIGMLYTLFVATTVFIAGTGVGFVATAVLVHNTHELDEGDAIEISYENRYYDLYFDETTDPITDDRMSELTGIHMEEKTPQGMVRMEWDNDTKTFLWYAKSGVPHNVLETVARKFVCDNKCACLYFNVHDAYYEENERYSNELKTFREASESEKLSNSASPTEDFVVVKDGTTSVSGDVPKIEPPKKSIFATFKNYTKNSVPKEGGSELMLMREIHEKNMTRIKSKMNRFRRGGSLNDHDELIVQRDSPHPNVPKDMSFEAFKRMRSSVTN